MTENAIKKEGAFEVLHAYERRIASVISNSDSKDFVFRGQPNTWEPYPSIIRPYLTDKGLKGIDCSTYIEAHERLLNDLRKIGSSDKCDLDILSKVQHRGGSTGLLDFTWSIRVALWFASQEYSEDNEEKDGRIYMIDANDVNNVEPVNKPENYDISNLFMMDDKNKQPILLWEPSIGDSTIDSRIMRQRSLFIITRFDNGQFFELTDIATPITIKATDKHHIVRALEYDNMDHRTLFFDFDGICIHHKNNPHIPAPKKSIDRTNGPDVSDQAKKEHLSLSIDILGEAYDCYGRRQFPRCIELCTECLNKQEQDGSIKHKDAVHYLRGNARVELVLENMSQNPVFEHGRPIRDAIEDFTSAIEIAEHDRTSNLNISEIYFNRGNAHAIINRHREAIDDFDHSEKNNDNSRNKRFSLFNKGNSWFKLKNYDKAFENFSECRNLGYVPAMHNLGNSSLLLEKYAEARDHYEEFAKQGDIPDYPNVKSIDDFMKKYDTTHGRERPRILHDNKQIKIHLGVRGAIDHSIGTNSMAYPFLGNMGNIGNYGIFRKNGYNGYSGGTGLKGDAGITVVIMFLI